MFTLLPSSGAFTDDLSTLTADTLNQWRAYFPRALDGGAGGAYTLSSKLQLGGSGLELTETSGAASRLQLASRDITRRMSMSAFTLSANWTVRPSLTWRNTASGGVIQVVMDRLANGATLKEVHARWKGAAGHGGMPTMPLFKIFKVDQDGVETQIGSTATDASADTTAYELKHSISKTGLVEVIDLTTYHYYVEVTGELGGNFVANAELYSFKHVQAITSYSEA